MSRYTERLNCPACGTPLARYAGTGQPGPQLLARWRRIRAEHQPDCQPQPVPAAQPA
jgi:hypothetical protein